ncbi:MAG TPA: AMP-binding protein [Pyrinomonadaceae bacterium]|nr:AMP-binding protein [Pyrinomonadaceae bacterium]
MTTRESILSFLDDCVSRGRETAFGYWRGVRLVRWSYRRVAETAYAFARELEARGVGRGDRVLLWASNGPEWVAAFYGCALRGAVVVPLDVESAPDFVERVRKQTEAKLLLTGSRERKHAAAPDVRDTLLARLPVLNLEELDDLTSRRSGARYESEGVKADDLVEIIYTSGTTAEPRGVCLTHRNLLSNLAPIESEIRKYARWERLTVHPLRFLNLLPLSHVFGQFMGIFVPQLLGGEVYFIDTLNPSEIASAVRRQRVSVVVTVPRLLETLREHVEREYAAGGRRESFEQSIEAAKSWNFVRRWWEFRRVHRKFGWKFWAFISGGATLPDETERFWRRLGFLVLQGYGMTETASLISVNHPFKNVGGSVGQALPGHEVKLSDEGEILVRGPNVSPGYWRGRVEPLADAEGWLHTGDLGELDEAGNIRFKGRRKDTIVTAAGLNIHPEDLEDALNRQPEVRTSAVVGVEGARGPEPVAVVIPREASADIASAVERANRELARHQQILRWHVWPDTDFPRTATHKVRKRDILERIKEGEKGKGEGGKENGRNGSGASVAAENVGAGGELSHVISSLVTRHSSLPSSPSADLSTDLKLDSLGRVELLSALEDRYQVEIDEATFTAATTLGDVERIVREGAAPDESRASRYPYPEWPLREPVRWLRVALLYLMSLPITAVLCWVRVRGKDNLKPLGRGPALFVSNHITYFDHALILSALPGPVRRRFAIAQEGERLRRWRYGVEGETWFTRLRRIAQYYLVLLFYNTFPLPQKSGFRRSFAYAGAAADRGYNLLVFPEGTRAEQGRLNPFMRGTGLLASQLGLPVVPVRIDGLYELKASGRRGFTRPYNVTVSFGEPLRFNPGEDPARITQELERRVAALEYRKGDRTRSTTEV